MIKTVLLIVVLGLSAATKSAYSQQQAAGEPPAKPAASAATPTETQSAATSIDREAEELRKGLAATEGRLHELETAMEKHLQDAQSAAQAADELMTMLQEYTKMLGPESKFIAVLGKGQEMALDIAHRAETDPDVEIQKMANSLKATAARIGKLKAAFIEESTKMIADIDRLGKLKHRMEFTRQVSSLEGFVKKAELYLDVVRRNADKARTLANDLSTMGQAPLTQ